MLLARVSAHTIGPEPRFAAMLATSGAADASCGRYRVTAMMPAARIAGTTMGAFRMDSYVKAMTPLRVHAIQHKIATLAWRRTPIWAAMCAQPSWCGGGAS